MMKNSIEKDILDVVYNPNYNFRMGVIVKGIEMHTFYLQGGKDVKDENKSNSRRCDRLAVAVRWLNFPTAEMDTGGNGEWVPVSLPLMGIGIQENGSDLTQDMIGRTSDFTTKTLNAWGILYGYDIGSYVLAQFTQLEDPIIVACFSPKGSWHGSDNSGFTIKPGEIKIRGKERQHLYVLEDGSIEISSGTNIVETTENKSGFISITKNGEVLKMEARSLEIVINDNDSVEKARITIDSDGNMVLNSNGNIKLGENATKGVLLVTAAELATLKTATPTPTLTMSSKVMVE